MATKAKNKKKKLNTEKLKEINFLKKLIRYSLDACDGHSIELDNLFVGQANKLMEQVRKLEKTQ
jgi:hypothetical protein